MGWRRIAATAVAVLLGVLSGCSSGSTSTTTSSTPPPGAADVIAEAATAMRAVTSAHFTITVSGDLPNVVVQSAEGALTSAGDAQGKGTIKQFGQLIEVEFVITGGDLYLKGATGGFTKVPAALAGQVYDPTALLDPDKGVAAVLTSATALGPTTQSGSNYVITGTVPKDVAASLAPGVDADVAATFTIDAATSTVSVVSFALTGADGQPASIELTLSELNTPVTVTAPGS